MANRKSKDTIRDERIEDITMYGEFISSFDQWITPDKQRQISRYLLEITEETSPEHGSSKNRKE
jgi:hypothetical protein